MGDTVHVELRQLAYFVAVAEEGSFTRGAQREHIVQSTMSAAVGRLEHEFGQALFRRIGHRIELTDAGILLLDQARSLLAASDDIKAQLDAHGGTVRGTVTLGTVYSTGTFELSAALIGLRRDHPGIAVRVHFSSPQFERHLDRVLDGTFDLVLTVPLDASLPDGPVTYADLAAMPFIDFPPGWPIRTHIDELFTDAGVDRDVAIEVADTGTALELVRGGLGLAFLPRRLVEGRIDVRAVEIDGPSLRRALVLAKPNTPQRPAVEAVHRALLAVGDPTIDS